MPVEMGEAFDLHEAVGVEGGQHETGCVGAGAAGPARRDSRLRRHEVGRGGTKGRALDGRLRCAVAPSSLSSISNMNFVVERQPVDARGGVVTM